MNIAEYVGWQYIFVVDETADTLQRAVVVHVTEMLASLGIPQPVIILLLCQYVRCVTFGNSRTCNSQSLFRTRGIQLCPLMHD